MRIILLFSLLLCFNSAFSQLNDSFEDGDISDSPAWRGDLTAYTVNVSKQLQTVPNAAASTVSLSAANTLALNTKWEFSIQLNFDPSTQNQVRIYLTADNADLKGSLNGYFIQIGESGSTDSYDLYKQSGNTVSKIIDGTAKTRSVNNVLKAKIIILRDGNGLWELKTAIDDSADFSTEGTVTDNTFSTSAYFGIYCKYTTTNSGKFIFDDFIIESTAPADTEPPELISATILDSLTIEAAFSEALDTISAKASSNYSLSNGYSSPSQVFTTTNPKTYLLKYPQNLPTGNYVLSVSGLKDLSGNTNTVNTINFNYKRPFIAKKGDLIITEIFADPVPQIDLPSVEFIEIFNQASETIKLDKWKYSDESVNTVFSDDSINPGEYIILCAKADTSNFKTYGKVIGLSPWPSLNNSGDRIKLTSPQGEVIDGVNYSEAWYGDNTKKSGGWSLERIDPESKCQGLFNWKASMDVTGGTPGKQNSSYIEDYDLIGLKADSVTISSDSVISIFFNKHLDIATVSPDKFSFNPLAAINNLHVNNYADQVEITLADKLAVNTTYNLGISDVSDCAGNILSTTLHFTTLAVPAAPPVIPDTAKIYITEIFADPSPEIGLPLAEFVEIYNPGKDTVNLDKWTLNDPSTKTTLKSVKILPDQYLILCPAADTVYYKDFGKAIGLSPWPSLNNAADQIVLRSLTGRTVDSVAYADSWYKDTQKKHGGWTLERIDPLSLCSGPFNWNSSQDSTGGTPGRTNSIAVVNFDKLLLVVDSLQSASNSITLFFNKPVDTAFVNSNKSSLSPTSGSINNISFSSSLKQAVLNFSQKFAPATAYNLDISGVSDCAGNTLSTTLHFTTPAVPAGPPVIPDTAQIYITEIFADPSPEIGLPLTEFVEIYNPGKDTVDLDKWTLNDPSTKATLKSVKILPDQYLILCPAADTVYYKDSGKAIGLSPWPSLNNVADQIVLRSLTGRSVDSVAYADSWYKDNLKKQGGWTLERINTYSTCSGFYNWSASVNKSGGTPGKINSINQEIDKLKIDDILVTSDSTLTLTFNIIPDTLSINPRFFTLDTGKEPSKASFFTETDYRKINLKFTTKFIEGETYNLTIDSLATCSGLQIERPDNRIHFSIPVIPERTYPLVINEIFADTSPVIGLPEAEYVELFNPTKEKIVLSGLRYEDIKGTGYTFQGGELKAGEFLILCPLKDTLNFTSYGKVQGLAPWASLNNDGDIILLKNNKGKEIQRVSYSASWYKNKEKQAGGYSLELINPEAICSGIQNWAASNASIGGTPGMENSVYDNSKSNDPLRITSCELLNDTTLLVSFNSLADSISLSSPNNFTVNNGIGNPLKTFPIGPDFKTVKLTFQSALARGKIYRIILSNVTDCSGSVISENAGSKEFLYPDKIIKGDILINEILFNPKPDGADFVEIYNASDKVLDLQQLSIGSIKEKDGSISTAQISNKPTLFNPHDILALSIDPENIKKEYYTERPDAFLKMEKMPGFNDDAGTVVLLSENERIDLLIYSEKMHFALIKDPEGVSLERSSYKTPTNEPGNFRSAAATVGFATPGYKNSQFNQLSESKSDVALQSKTFSPDNDGFEDILTINYHFPGQGRIANVTIYTDKGSLVRRLYKNLSLAAEGSLIWDGLNEWNQKAQIGVYVLFMEVFDLNGNVKRYRKNFVLAGKLN
ncbi:lamin tail domain-containing protein [Rubrolithibacter danxiaensis]|uniref:lamin tail domain-containing protein n=1 Tax=Rubrolithibacter danxiaensis TaxID=3390805 RepID=UPI003BF85AA3